MNNIIIDDDLYDEAVKIVMYHGKVSTAFLQRTLRIGYFCAMHLLELMEKQKLIGPVNGSKPRKIYNNKYLKK